MGSKSKWIGLIILLAVIRGGGGLSVAGRRPPAEPAVLRGYVGGEKIGLLEDEAVQDILERDYGLTLDYAKAGSWTWWRRITRAGFPLSLQPDRPGVLPAALRRAGQEPDRVQHPHRPLSPTGPSWRRSRKRGW